MRLSRAGRISRDVSSNSVTTQSDVRNWRVDRNPCSYRIAAWLKDDVFAGPPMGKLLDVFRRWLVTTASDVHTDARVVVGNEIGGAVYEMVHGRHLPEHANTRVIDPSTSELGYLAAPILAG